MNSKERPRKVVIEQLFLAYTDRHCIADLRRAEAKKMRGSDDSDDDKPKKKAATRSAKANGKGKR